MKFNYNDGGRKAAGITKKDKGACACRALAIATQRPYLEIYALIKHFAKMERTSKHKSDKSDPETGVYRPTMLKILEVLGWESVPCMGIGTGCRVHLRDGELPSGRIIANVSRHYTAIIDGVINDTFDPSRGGTRCVYNYYRPTDHALKPTDPLPIAVEPINIINGRAVTATKGNTKAKNKERLAPSRARFDEWGYRLMTYSEIKREAEALIQTELRPYYIGCTIDKDSNNHYTAWGSEIYLNFKRPVITIITDARYVHGCLEDIAADLDDLYIGDDTPDENADYSDYDEENDGKPIAPIRTPYSPYDRHKATARWTNHERVKTHRVA